MGGSCGGCLGAWVKVVNVGSLQDRGSSAGGMGLGWILGPISLQKVKKMAFRFHSVYWEVLQNARRVAECPAPSLGYKQPENLT